MNTYSLVFFHSRLTNFVRENNVQVFEEENRAENNMERMMNSVLTVLNQIKTQNNSEEVKNAIVEMRNQISKNFNDALKRKINKLFDQFATSS